MLNLLADEVLDLYQPYLEEVPLVLREPFIPMNLARGIGSEAERVLRSEPTLLRLNGPIVVIGDVHGHLFDLYLILRKYGLPPKTKYLFLGDMVDRGEFSVQTVCLIFALKVKYPDSIYIIRGNHEFRGVCKRGGFFSDCGVIYPKSDMFDIYCCAFDQLPLGATINGNIFCIHGGLVPGFHSVEQIAAMKKPDTDEPDGFVAGLLWGDPDEVIEDFGPSKRGCGFGYGKSAVMNFLKTSGMSMIIRGHECVDLGLRYSFDGTLVTLFSASQYCGCMSNVAASAHIDENGKITHTEFSVAREIEENSVIVPETKNVQKRYRVARGSRHVITPNFSAENSLLPTGTPKTFLRRGKVAKTMGIFNSKYKLPGLKTRSAVISQSDDTE